MSWINDPNTNRTLTGKTCRCSTSTFMVTPGQVWAQPSNWLDRPGGNDVGTLRQLPQVLRCVLVVSFLHHYSMVASLSASESLTRDRKVSEATLRFVIYSKDGLVIAARTLE